MQTLLTALLFLSVLVSATALLYARHEYRKRGKLTWFGLFLLCAMILMPNLVLDYATRYEMPESPLDWAGVLIALAGIAVIVASLIVFRSLAKMLCVTTGELTVTGLYRWSRNPQYVGFLMFLLGYALNDWSLWCLAALVVQAINLHLLVLIEEEHLRRVFGDPYIEFCCKTPRYWRWPTRPVAAKN